MVQELCPGGNLTKRGPAKSDMPLGIERSQSSGLPRRPIIGTIYSSSTVDAALTMVFYIGVDDLDI